MPSVVAQEHGDGDTFHFLVQAKLPLLAAQVASRAMPIGNLTGMTEDERSELLGWIHDGAPR